MTFKENFDIKGLKWALYDEFGVLFVNLVFQGRMWKLIHTHPIVLPGEQECPMMDLGGR